MINKSMPWIRFVEGAGDAPVSNEGANSDSNETSEKEESKGLNAEVERWKAFSRKWEERAKENDEARKRLDELENANKSELEKSQASIEELKQELAEAREALSKADADRLKLDIASEFKISKDDRELFLTASDEETLRKQAEALAKRRAPENSNQGKGGPSNSKASATDWAKSLLNNK